MCFLSCAIVAFISKDLYKSPENNSFFKNLLIFINLTLYFPWIVFEIIKSNLAVADIILSRNIEEAIDPEIINYKTKLNSKLSRVIFANSITLTPGTVTMSLFNDELVIHALSSEGAVNGIAKIENKLLRVFRQEVA